jgi:hypothetical protein
VGRIAGLPEQGRKCVQTRRQAPENKNANRDLCTTFTTITEELVAGDMLSG